MKVVIVGDGKVGGTIARQLSGEGHDIIVIDNNIAFINKFFVLFSIQYF